MLAKRRGGEQFFPVAGIGRGWREREGLFAAWALRTQFNGGKSSFGYGVVVRKEPDRLASPPRRVRLPRCGADPPWTAGLNRCLGTDYPAFSFTRRNTWK